MNSGDAAAKIKKQTGPPSSLGIAGNNSLLLHQRRPRKRELQEQRYWTDQEVAQRDQICATKQKNLKEAHVIQHH